LRKADQTNDLQQVKLLLSQLGKTPFLKKVKPTPYDEALSLVLCLENVFYYTTGSIYNYIKANTDNPKSFNNQVVELGFWPGGDRNGNPFVTAQTTIDVANKLRSRLFRNYYRDLKHLPHRLSFNAVEEALATLELQCHDAIEHRGMLPFTMTDLFYDLKKIRETLINQHGSLFLSMLNSFINQGETIWFSLCSTEYKTR
jgi:phosphoenolpyruvate carboxylase